VRLAGLMPELHVCIGCGEFLETQKAFFSRNRSGIYCQSCRHSLDLRGTWELTAESRGIAEEILHTPVAALSERPWSQATAADLRRLLIQQIENHIERKLITVPVLEFA
jgi:DNA repair protein RecO (recombination protein O)